MMNRIVHSKRRWLVAALVVAALAASLLTVAAEHRPAEITADPPEPVYPEDGADVTGNPDDPNKGTDWLVHEPLGIPHFSWTGVVTGPFKLEVATTAAFGDSIILAVDDITHNTYTPTGFERDLDDPGFGLTEDQGDFLDQADFYWRVQAWDDELGVWGDPSDTFMFTRHWGYQPSLSFPPDNSTQDVTPYFSWEPVPGASFYQIQVDTNPGFGSPLIDATTDMPTFTPTGLKSGEKLANDDDLFWRVRAFHYPNQRRPSDGRGGVWSATWQFKLAWSSKIDTAGAAYDTRPLPLTPPNNANYINGPLFCWQPVAGAIKYHIYLSLTPSFDTGLIIDGGRIEGRTEGTCYTFKRDGNYTLLTGTDYYWRVIAEDAAGNWGQPSNELGGVFRFKTAPEAPPTAPTPFYPPYYYAPVNGGQAFEDRTVALPTFVWDHVDGATSYQLCIDDAPAMDCTSGEAIVVETANASFTFTDTQTYPLADGQTYYWKVRSNLSPAWSQLFNQWMARVDRTRMTVHSDVQLIQPTYQQEVWAGNKKYGQESVTYYPSFAWTAVAPLGDVTYQIQVAHDPAFTALAHEAQTDFTAYTPVERPEPGTYYWRVRPAGTASAWSEPGRFTVSRNFTPLNADTPQIAVDGSALDWTDLEAPFYAPDGEDGDVTDGDLSGFYVAANPTDWFLGLPLPAGAGLGIYLDTDRYDDSGADVAPPPGGATDLPAAHRPEYAIYWSATVTQGQFYRWTGSSWVYQGVLDAVGGTASYGAGEGFLELSFKASAVGFPGSLSLLLFSLDETAVQDLLPNQPGDAGAPAFLTESTAPTPLFPANAPRDESLATVERNTPVLTWRHNNVIPESYGKSPFYFETFQDDTVSTLYEDEAGPSPDQPPKTYAFWNSFTHWAPQVFYSDNDSYVWRVKRMEFAPTVSNRFIKRGYLATELAFSPRVTSEGITYTNRTPSFYWAPAQSAATYLWELYEGTDLAEDQETMVPYYTPRDAIKDGTYTWRVWAVDARGRAGAQAAQGVFSKLYDTLQDISVLVEGKKLTFSWQPVEHAAYYQVLIDIDPNFSNPEEYKTYNTVLVPEDLKDDWFSQPMYARVYMVDNQKNKGPDVDLNIGIRVFLPLVLRNR
jgi:hypothetical protein